MPVTMAVTFAYELIANAMSDAVRAKYPLIDPTETVALEIARKALATVSLPFEIDIDIRESLIVDLSEIAQGNGPQWGLWAAAAREALSLQATRRETERWKKDRESQAMR